MAMITGRFDVIATDIESPYEIAGFVNAMAAKHFSVNRQNI